MTKVYNEPEQILPEIHVGDSGTSFISQILDQTGVAVDLSTATSTGFRFESPSHVVTDKSAVLLTDGKDGKIIYILEPDFMDESGGWKYQAIISIGGGTWYTNEVKFEVYPSIPAPIIP